MAILGVHLVCCTIQNLLNTRLLAAGLTHADLAPTYEPTDTAALNQRCLITCVGGVDDVRQKERFNWLRKADMDCTDFSARGFLHTTHNANF